MRQIRYNVFETNSSSTHSIVICDKYLYDEWLEDRAYLLKFSDEIVEDIPEDERSWAKTQYLTRTEFNDVGGQEICTKTFKDSNGISKLALTIYMHD
jgi:hypothetical protein